MGYFFLFSNILSYDIIVIDSSTSMKNIFRNWFLPILHLILIIFVYASPWLIPWQYILIILVLYRLQLWIFKGCILTIFQFGKERTSFCFHYLKKVFPKLQRKTLNIIMDSILPVALVCVAYIIQK
jgi:hypothetical protein